MRIVALVQQEGEGVLAKAGPRLIARQDALPSFEGIEPSPGLAKAAETDGTTGSSKEAQEAGNEDMFLGDEE